METADEIANKLAFVGMPDEDSRIHAQRIAEGVARYPIRGFRVLPPQGITREIAIVEYEFGDNGYSFDNAKPTDVPDFQPTDHGGSQCDQENLLFLARAFEIAEAAVPELWLNPDNDLIGKLTSPRQHLNTLNEFWWLSRWNPGFAVVPNYELNPACSMNVDWRLSWRFWPNIDLHVNLEVKRRIVDVLRSAQGQPVAPDDIFTAGVNDKKGDSKFRPSGPDEINVLGVTLIGEIDHDVQMEAEKWLQSRPDIDALLLFSRFSVRKAGFDAQITRKAELLKQVLNPKLGPIDVSLHGRVRTPLPFTIPQLASWLHENRP